ncbi:MAG: hypothetical protein KBE09_01180 [Candidatus Pacebacteria bacterium]|nr:hypothetical protein [Candidatus Paceibacterota bacterium]
MKQLIADLKERPKEDRAAFAGLIAGVFAVVLFVVWATFFVRGIQHSARTNAAREVAAGEVYQDPASMARDAAEELSARYDDAANQYTQINSAAAQVAAVGQLPLGEDVTIGSVTVLATSTPTPKSDVSDAPGAEESGF